ncbi:MAG: hypothetical protein H6835_12175 [Planctomycetes bacterium]|nr:hypothetical protein [Planctomycetota bacterium]
MSHRFRLSTLVSSLFVLAALPAQELQPGAEAPAFSLSQMVRGEPLKELPKGAVTLVEFWGDQPGMGFDRAREFGRLKKAHGDKLHLVGVVGPSDDEYDFEAVADYYAEHGEHLRFTIGFDADGKLHEAWAKAAGNEPPALFLVDEKGRVAWIGGLGFLPLVLPKVMAGDCDPAALAEDTGAAQKQMVRLVMTASLKPSGAMAEMDKMIKQWPLLETMAVTTAWSSLLDSDEPKLAIPLEKRVCDVATKDEDANTLNWLAWQIVDPDIERAERDLVTAERAAKQAVALTEEKDPSLLDTLARVYFWTKDYKQAVAWQKKAIAALGDEDEGRDGLEATLAEYERLVGEAGK